jgi:pentatricopeptide repeat protein
MACRYVCTTLLAVLGKCLRPVEALNVFNVMRVCFLNLKFLFLCLLLLVVDSVQECCRRLQLV